MQTRITYDDREIRAGLDELSRQLRSNAYGQLTAAAARVVRRRARRRRYGYNDITGRLRRSIRVVRERGKNSSISRLTAGAVGARQAYLVEAGHGGPFPARPHPYLKRALRETLPKQRAAVIEKARVVVPKAVQRAAQRAARK